MSKLIISITMTVDGVIDVGEWYISEGGHNRASLTSSRMRQRW
jgi:hypothetical protein